MITNRVEANAPTTFVGSSRVPLPRRVLFLATDAHGGFGVLRDLMERRHG